MKYPNCLRSCREAQNLTRTNLSLETRKLIFVSKEPFKGITPKFLKKLETHSIYFLRKIKVKQFDHHWIVKDKFRSLRIESGAGPYYFAKEPGICVKIIRAIENGARCREKTQKILAQALGKRVKEVFDNTSRSEQPAYLKTK